MFVGNIHEIYQCSTVVLHKHFQLLGNHTPTDQVLVFVPTYKSSRVNLFSSGSGQPGLVCSARWYTWPTRHLAMIVLKSWVYLCEGWRHVRLCNLPIYRLSTSSLVMVYMQNPAPMSVGWTSCVGMNLLYYYYNNDCAEYAKKIPCMDIFLPLTVGRYSTVVAVSSLQLTEKHFMYNIKVMGHFQQRIPNHLPF